MKLSLTYQRDIGPSLTITLVHYEGNLNKIKIFIVHVFV